MDYDLLSQAPLFRGMTSDDVKTLLGKVSFRVKKYQAGSMIAQSGETVNSLIIIMSGTVKGEMADYAGRVIKIEEIPAPGALAAAFIFGNLNKFPVNVTALSEVEMIMIDRPEFLRMLREKDEILINFLNIISNRSQFLSEKIKFLNFKTIRGKLAYYILQKAGKDSMSVNLGMTQADLADFFGVARPSVARALGELEAESYINARGKIIYITDRQGLAAMTRE